MILATVVEDYVNAAIANAEVIALESGTLVATIPGCPGIVARGADGHECAEDLYHRLEKWVLVSLARGNKLPIMAGIDLNTDVNRTLASYDASCVASARDANTVFQNEAETEAAFEVRDRSD